MITCTCCGRTVCCTADCARLRRLLAERLATLPPVEEWEEQELGRYDPVYGGKK